MTTSPRRVRGRGLVGRHDELTAMASVLERGAVDAAVLALVGVPGIGKSALLAAAGCLADDLDRTVLSCVGVEAEAHFPFAALYQLLQPVLDHVDDLRAQERTALLTAFGLDEGESQPDLFLIAQAVLELLTASAARRPVVLLADDVQWLDPPSRDCLAYVARRVDAVAMSIIVTVRVESPDRRPAFLTAFSEILQVGGLGDEAAAEILRNSGSDLSGADRNRILDVARGNPLALTELPTMWRGMAARETTPPLSTRLERDFGGRAIQLPAATRDVLLVAAVDDGREAEEILAAASILAGRSVTADDVTSAREVGLLISGTELVEFRHPLMRSGILLTERVSRRQAAHGALAAVLVDSPYRRAWHRAQAIVGPDDAIADELEQTVEESLRRGAVMTAIGSLERAAHLTSVSARRGHRLLKAAEHAFGVGHVEVVDRLVGEAAATDLDELDWGRMQWLREIFNDGVPGDAPRVMELCDIAFRSAAAGDDDLALNLLLGAALRCWWADTGPVARAHVAEIVLTLSLDDDPRAVAALAVAEPVAQAAAVTRALDRLPAGTGLNADALRLLGMAAHAIGDSARSDDYLTAAELQLRRQQRLGVLAHALSMHVIVALELGDWDGAATASAEAIELGAETGQPIWTTGSLVCQALALALLGHAQRALDLVAEVELTANRSRLNDLLSCAQLARGIAYITLGRPSEAYVALRRLFDPADPAYHQRQCFGGLMYLAEAAVLSNWRDDALTVVEQLERVAAITPSPVLHLHLQHARAVLADDMHSEALFRAAMTEDVRRGPWMKARIELAFGIWLRGQGRAVEAMPFLESARQTLERIGAVHWASIARRAIGQTPFRPDSR